MCCLRDGDTPSVSLPQYLTLLIFDDVSRAIRSHYYMYLLTNQKPLFNILTNQVAALTRKGDGTRSQPVTVKTPGGVPSRPDVDLK